MPERIRRGIANCERLMVLLAVWATFIIMGITTADALGRYVFNRSIIGVYEITERYLMVAAVFLAVGYGYRRGAYIRVTFLIDRLPQKAKFVRHLQSDFLHFAQCLSYCRYGQAGYFHSGKRHNSGRIELPPMAGVHDCPRGPVFHVIAAAA